MKLLTRFLLKIYDTVFAWFTPTWRREGHAIASTIRRYLRHNEDKLSAERYQELAEPLEKLRLSLQGWNKEEVRQLSQLLTLRSESYAGAKRPFIAEMVESIFVIMVVFLGIRSYYAQPFRIPTGSMQPSLNGIRLIPIEEKPAFAQRAWDAVTLGSSYIDEVADSPKLLLSPSHVVQKQKWLLFVESEITFNDGSKISVPCAPGAVFKYLKEQGNYYPEGPSGPLARFDAGDRIIRARSDAGDMVVVNRMAYHFRKPTRGESFVFDTRGIPTDGTKPLGIRDQSDGSHYIKRLAAVPGDSISLRQPHIIINGEIAKEATFERVMSCKPPYNPSGYHGIEPLEYANGKMQARSVWLAPGETQTLANPKEAPHMREYAALGDNTENSLDSRYWGTVRQYNIVGPALLALWPFTDHWGIIP